MEITPREQQWLDEAPAYPITCKACRAENSSRHKFCEQCSSPLNDDAFDVLYAPALAQGRKWIGIISVLYLIGGVLMCAVTWGDDQGLALLVLALNLVLAATQGAFWWWAKRATFAAAVASLTLYVSVVLVEGVLDPSSLLRGWLIKAISITALVQAIKAGLSVRRLRAEAQAAATQAAESQTAA